MTLDTVGPLLSNWRYGTANFVNNLGVSAPDTIWVDASDIATVAQVQFFIRQGAGGSDVLLGTDTNGGDGYSAYWNATVTTANGPYVVTIKAADSFGNLTTESRTLNLTLAVPGAVTLQQPTNGQLVGQPNMVLSGTAPSDTLVALYLNGVQQGSLITPGTGGQFSRTVTLAAGSNIIEAAAQNRVGEGPRTSALVTLDLSIPGAPVAPQATSIASGAIQLTWARPAGSVGGYKVYRSASPFDDLAQATLVTASQVTGTVYSDTPTSEGIYHYRITAVSPAGNESAGSTQVSAVSDKTPPVATSIQYVTDGKFDAATGRFGTGLVTVTMNVNEPLGSLPFFSLTPHNGIPIVVNLQQVSALRFSGSLVIASSTPSGVATATVSMRDVAGNRGTAITTGGTLLIDTAGPSVVNLAIQPSQSIKNNPAALATAVFTATLDQPVKSGTTPQFNYLLSNTAPTPAVIPNVVPGADNLTWVVTLPLPSTAGQTTENLVLGFQALDDLDNAGTQIVPTHQFQVYQGNLPGLDSPLSLTAQSAPAGHIALSWRSVEGAADYQVFRRISGAGTLVPAAVSGGLLTYSDLPPSDGTYDYTVAAIRQENGQVSTGAQSNVATAVSDRVAPGAPTNLQVAVVPQGVQAQWHAPANVLENITYSLYRAATNPADFEVVGRGINQLNVIDAAPNPARPYYYVTAVDAAGNESQPSNRVYQDVQLLPVQTLNVSQTDASPPAISWSQVSGNIAGYDIYQGIEPQKTKLNTAGLLTGTTYTDAGFSPGADRVYTVVTVDNNLMESVGRTITLPRINATLQDGAVVNVGVMNRLNYTVRNDSATQVDNIRITVLLGGRNHISSVFSLAPGASQVVPVVVGGYATLTGSTAPIVTTLQITPSPGESVSIIRNGLVSLGVGQLQLDLTPGSFLQGGNGGAGFSLTNSSTEEIEITTGAGNGAQPSPEVRFTLLDSDGNVLVTQPFKAVTGDVVVTLPSGSSVVRLPAGTVFASQQTLITVPPNAATQLTLRLQLDHIYYHQGQPDEVVLDGLQIRRNISLTQTSYTVAVTSVTPVESNGDQNIAISGQALTRAGNQPAANARLLVYISKDGFDRIGEVFTDNAGLFSYTFTPVLSEGGGIYNVWAAHPDLTDRTVQQSFVIRRVLVSPTQGNVSTARNYSQPVNFTATTGAGVTVHNLRLQYLAEDQYGAALVPGIAVGPDPPQATISPNQSVQLNARVTGSNDAPQQGTIILRVSSDESNASGWQKITLSYQLGVANPFLSATPSFVNSGVTPGNSITETVTFANNGLATAEGVSFILLSQDGSVAPAWVSLSVAGSGNLPVGGSLPVGIVFQPVTGTPQNDYFFILRVQGTNFATQDVNIHLAVTDVGQGGVLFKVRDPFTGTLDGTGAVIQGVQNATIVVQNEQVLSVTQTLTTDSYGEASFSGLPAGSYKYRANADKHSTATGRFWVRPGTTVNQDIGLQYNPVTITWEVVPVTIQDRYNIILNTTFETSVPTPVVVVNPPLVNLPRMCKGDVYNGEFTVTNYGLIRADNVMVPVPQSDARFKVELLTGTPTQLGAGEVMRVVYRMTALADFGGNCSTPVASGNFTPLQAAASLNPKASSAAEISAPALASPQAPTAPAGNGGGGCVSWGATFSVSYTYCCPNGLCFSGVATFSKLAPDRVESVSGMDLYDREGRILRTDFGDWTLLNCYFPSGTAGDERQAFKMVFLDDFFHWIGELKKERPKLIVVGDYNIAHKEIDIHNPKGNIKSSGFLPEEREWFTKWFEAGFADAFRALESEIVEYSWWSHRFNSRAQNKGWRIDYQSVSNNLKDKILNAAHLTDVVHSDHCPVLMEIDL